MRSQNEPTFRLKSSRSITTLARREKGWRYESDSLRNSSEIQDRENDTIDERSSTRTSPVVNSDANRDGGLAATPDRGRVICDGGRRENSAANPGAGPSYLTTRDRVWSATLELLEEPQEVDHPTGGVGGVYIVNGTGVLNTSAKSFSSGIKHRASSAQPYLYSIQVNL